MCVDYQVLNKVTIKNKYLVLLIVLFGLMNALTIFFNLMNDVLCRMCVAS
jgi:hypothetical protein